MTVIQRSVLSLALILASLGFSGCAAMPKIEKPRFTQRHYTYSVLLVPEKLGKSPQLEVAMSLLRMEYPADQAEAFHTLLYGQPSLDEYKDAVLSDQRKNYRSRAGALPADGSGAASFNWRYVERFSIKNIHELGIVIERELEAYSGGANASRLTQYYNIEIEVDTHRLLTLKDLLDEFQENQQYRDIVYEELRKRSKLNSAQPLSQGIYFNNQPELTFNFFITDDGLGLHWDPAQIAPRSEGSIQIILPWDIIGPLVLPEGVQILAKYDIDLFPDISEE